MSNIDTNRNQHWHIQDALAEGAILSVRSAFKNRLIFIARLDWINHDEHKSVTSQIATTIDGALRDLNERLEADSKNNP